MPYKFETDKKLIPRKLKRTVKLSLKQREEIFQNLSGLSMRGLAKAYGVSRRLIQFIRFPERLAKNLIDRQNRGGTKIYYDKDKHRETMKGTRSYKKTIEEKLI